MATARRRVLISGMVQGVAFRAYTRHAARQARVGGWVRNLPDGRVEAVFEGSTEDVTQMVEWCRRGSPGSRVDHVDIIEESPKDESSDFQITYVRGDYW